jgi:hypothetical protein
MDHMQSIGEEQANFWSYHFTMVGYFHYIQQRKLVYLDFLAKTHFISQNFCRKIDKVNMNNTVI